MIDRNATGPLTMEELQINIPADLKRRLSEAKQACWLREIENLAAESGDPATSDPEAVEHLNGIEPEDWSQLKPHMKRSLLAQAIASKAITLC